jgi:hypothetical protein
MGCQQAREGIGNGTCKRNSGVGPRRAQSLSFCAASVVCSSAPTVCATRAVCTATCPTTAASRPGSVLPDGVRLSLQLSPSRVLERKSHQGPAAPHPARRFRVHSKLPHRARARLLWLDRPTLRSVFYCDRVLAVLDWTKSQRRVPYAL